jgi:uncharacterized protein YidB (DUF937 family)
MIHNGKIGKLPGAIREQLNRRLHDGGQGRQLLEWLNSLPEVQAVVARDFVGKPIRKQNLSQWRNGGYKEWLRQREALDLIRQLPGDVAELQPPGSPTLADQMAVWLTAHYMLAVQRLAEKSGNGEIELKVLRELLHDILAVRRGDHSDARLKMEQERLDREREKAGEEVIAHFQRWVKNPEVRDLICQIYISPEEREAQIREVFGRPPKTPSPPEPPAKASAGPAESNPVKPSQTESNQIQPDE